MAAAVPIAAEAAFEFAPILAEAAKDLVIPILMEGGKYALKEISPYVMDAGKFLAGKVMNAVGKGQSVSSAVKEGINHLGDDLIASTQFTPQNPLTSPNTSFTVQKPFTHLNQVAHVGLNTLTNLPNTGSLKDKILSGSLKPPRVVNPPRNAMTPDNSPTYKVAATIMYPKIGIKRQQVLN